MLLGMRSLTALVSIDMTLSISLIHFFQVVPGATSTAHVNTAARNAAVTSLIVCCGFIACFTPYGIMLVVGFSGSDKFDFGKWYYVLVNVVMLTNSCINPVIYAAKYREFQHGVRLLLAKLKLIEQQSHATAVT